MAGIKSDAVEDVLELLKKGLGSQFKTYYDGDPDMIPMFNLPCLVVEETRDDTTGAAWGQDDIADSIRIRVIFDKKDDWTAKHDPLNSTQTRMRRIIGARDAETGKYLPNTIKGILRPHLYSSDRIDSDMSIEYGPNIRPNNDGKPYTTNEASITIKTSTTVDIDLPG